MVFYKNTTNHKPKYAGFSLHIQDKGDQMLRSFLLATGIILTGCATTKPAYRSEMRVFSANDAGQYDVWFKVEDISNPSKPTIISSPQIKIIENQEGTVFVGDEQNSLHFTAIVNEDAETEVATVQTTVFIKEKGEVVWTHKETVFLKDE